MAYDFNSLTKQADEASNRDKFYTDFEDVDPNKLHQISELTEWMRTKGKGSDVREVIAQLFERTWLENIKEGNANMEVAEARGTDATLGDRLQSMDGKIAQTKTDITRTDARIDGLIANAGNGTVPSELTDMRVAFDGQTYPTAGQAVREQFKKALIGDRQIAAESDLVSPYNDLNTVPFNTVITYAYYANALNKPNANFSGGATVFTANYTKNAYPGAFQLLIQSDGTMYSRIYWYVDGKNQWLPWKKILTEQDLPQNIGTDPFQPSLALFEKIGVIGDSYSSGEIYPDGPSGFDNYNLSWGQILARKNGVTCTNFSKGGLTTRSWLTDDTGLAKLNSSEAQNLYYISLGINDNNMLGTGYIGTESDMDSGADTFYGNYAKIINAVKAKAPHAKIILIDPAWSTGKTDPYYVATKNIATKFGLPLIKHRDDSFLSSDKFKRELMEYGHPVAISYAAMASAFERLTMQAIRDNIAYFKDYRG